MKKFGFSKKDKGGEDDANRSVLFSSKNKKSSSSAENPYAAAPAGPDPYSTNNYNNNHSIPPPAYNNGSNPSVDRFRQDKSPVPPGGYGGPGGGASGYGSGSAGAAGSSRYGPGPGGSSGYGGASGYGAGGENPYGVASGGAPASRYGTGGYGGFGRQTSTMSQDTDVGRAELFGNAPQRLQQQHGAQPGPSGQAGMPGGYQQQGPVPGTWESGTGDNYGQSTDYGAYADRQLTAEEQEEEDIQAAKQEIRFIKQQDVASTRNALRIAQQAEETGRQTLERLGQQGERIHNTERNLDLASNQNRLAAEKARELKTLNRSMFAVHVSNPFTSSKRTAEREQAVLDQSRKDRDVRDATRAAAWDSNARQAAFARDTNKSGAQAKTGASLAERSKYQFEADSEDEAMEDEIDQNLDLLHGAAQRLNGLGRAMGREVDEQNKHIARIGGKVDRVDDEIALNRSRLDRIR